MTGECAKGLPGHNYTDTDYGWDAGFRLDVICDDPSHGGKRAVVVAFTRDCSPNETFRETPPPTWRWFVDGITTRAHRSAEERAFSEWKPDRQGGKLSEILKSAPHIEGDTRWVNDTVSESGEVLGQGLGHRDAGTHEKYRLMCKCGLDVQARDERIVPILEALHDHSITDVTLSALAVRLR